MGPILAYLDPGSGSLLLQMILGGIAGVVLVFKRFRMWILSPFSRSKRPPEAPSGGAGPRQDD